jgi:PAS domain S-box-containing protein
MKYTLVLTLMKKNKRYWRGVSLVIILILFAFRTSGFTQGNAGFYRISCEEEFLEATVNGILQDPRGFIWLATFNGLHRYDGYKCTLYRHDPNDSKSISSKNVTCLCLDSEGTLWVGTYDNGFNRFHWETETFTQYHSNENNHPGPKHDGINVIYEDQKGYLWIGTLEGGVKRFDKKTGKFKRFQHDPGNQHSLSNNNVISICQDSKGRLWIGTQDGLNRWDPEKEVFTPYNLEPGGPGALERNHIKVIYEDRKGNLWIGIWGGGLCQYIQEEDRFVRCSITTIPQGNTNANRINISSLYEDQYGTLWVGTFGDGLYKLSREKKTLESFPPDVGSPPILSSKLITGIYEDKSGLLWIGTEAGGVNIYDRKKGKFSHFTHNPLDDKSLCGDMVQALCISPDEGGEGEILWVGTYSGLTRIDRKENKFTHFRHDPKDPHGISSDVIRGIFIDSYNVFWIGTRSGLNQLDPKTDGFTYFQNEPGNPGSISDNRIAPICEDKKRRLWIGTEMGLNLFKRGEKSFQRYVNDPGNPYSLSKDNILCMSEQIINGESVLWIGTYNGGLNKFIVEEGKFYHYNTTKTGPQGKFSSDIIRTIYIDKNNILWLGTDGGLNRFDTNTGEVSVFTEKQGLCNNQVYGILENETGHLWLSTENGLSRFDKNTREFNTFNEGNGVPIRRFNLGAYYKSQKGEMFFGGVNGFVSFFPGKVETNLHIPGIVITDFKIFNKPVGIGKYLEKSITEADKIRLSYRENMFSFEFAALDYTCSENNQYKYKMKGFDKEWIETDAKNRLAQYTNLDHGKYTFIVKGSNNDGVWDETGISLKITITPPYWETWWFRIVLGLSFILVLLFFYLQRTRRLREKLSGQQRIQEILKKSHDEMEQAKDLAEFRRAEIEKLISAISSLLIAVDFNGKIFQLNETAEKFFNIPASQTIGQLFVEVLKDYISPDMLNMIIEKGLGKDNIYDNFEIPIQFNNGGGKLLLGVINPFMDREGQKLGFLLLAEDITHRKEDEMRRNLAQKLESLGKMIRNIAHEIKSPLQYIGNNSYFILDAFENLVKFVDTLKQSVTNIAKSNPIDMKEEIEKIVEEYDIGYILEEGPKASDQIVRGVSRVSTIIQSMLNYTHPGRSVLEQANIHELFENTLIFIRSKKKDIFEIETEFDRDIPQVLCYPGELIQVFMNLLINAADAIQEKGKPGLIKITTSYNENEVIIAIADNGCGIPDEIKDNIYNPFFTTKEVGKGTGQGLALVHNIVTQRHKGRIYFESQVGEGTTFYVHLPISLEDPDDGHEPGGGEE